MKKIIDYKIISIECEPRLFDKTNTPLNMETLVVNEIKNGWQPYGELKFQIAQTGSLFGSTGHPIFTQAMVKYED